MVLIAVPTTGDVRYTLVEKLLKFNERDDVEITFNEAFPVDVNRCEIVNEFLDSDHDTLLMIDSDIIPPENLLEILDHDKSIITPVVFSLKEGVPYPVASVMGENDQLQMYSGDADGVIEVDGVGTGCIAVRREVFEHLEEPYFEFTKHEDGTLNTGEDFNFCLDAKEAGFNIYMDTDKVAGHITETDLEKTMEVMKLALDANPSDIFVEEVG